MSVPYSTTAPIWRCGPLSPTAAQQAIAVMRQLVPRPFRPQVAAAVYGDAIELYLLDLHAHATMILLAGQIAAAEISGPDALPDAPVWIYDPWVDRFLAGRIRGEAAPTLRTVRRAA